MRKGRHTSIILVAAQLICEGLSALLSRIPGMRVVGQASDRQQALRLVARLHPDVAIADLSLSGIDVLELVREAGAASAGTRWIVLSAESGTGRAVDALRHGAAGYLLKHSRGEELARAIRDVAAGRRVLSPALPQAEIESALRDSAPGSDPYESLTPRERQVFLLAAEGNGNAQIGRRLFISPRTVEIHRANAMRKIGLDSLTELIRYAIRRGLVPLDE